MYYNYHPASKNPLSQSGNIVCFYFPSVAMAIQQSYSAIPKSVHPKRIAGNIDIFNFEMPHEDMDRINRLNTDI